MVHLICPKCKEYLRPGYYNADKVYARTVITCKLCYYIGEIDMFEHPLRSQDIQVELTTPTSRLPSRQHPDDAGYDLYANEALTINVGATKLVRCGIKMAIPPGYMGFICPRSGLSLKHGITVLNGPGVIDSGYVGEIGVVLINFGVRNFEVEVGDRIGQIVFVELAKLDLVAGKVDGGRSGGFGSTGR